MDALRPGEYGVLHGVTEYRVDAKRVIELRTMVDATLYFLMRKWKSWDDQTFVPELIVKVADHEGRKRTRCVKYDHSSKALADYRTLSDEQIAMDAFAIFDGPHDGTVTATPLGGSVTFCELDSIEKARHEMVPFEGASGGGQPGKRPYIDEYMPMGGFLKRLLLLPKDEVPKAIRQYITEPYEFKRGLTKCARYCKNKSAMIRDVLFRYDFLSGVDVSRSYYIPELCKTVLVFGENHDHPRSCEDLLLSSIGTKAATVGTIVRDCMHILGVQECRDDPPMLCMVEGSPHLFEAYVRTLRHLRDDQEFGPSDDLDMAATFAAAYHMDPRAAVYIDIRDELLLYVIGRKFSRIRVWMGPDEDPDDEFNDETFLILLFLTKDLPLVVEEFPPMREVFGLVPKRVQQYLVDTLKRWTQEMVNRYSDLYRNTNVKTDYDGETSYNLADMENRKEADRTLRFDAMDTMTFLMDLYTVCKIVSSTQNFIIVHEGYVHADNLDAMLNDLFSIDERMELSAQTFGNRVKDAYFCKRYRHCDRSTTCPHYDDPDFVADMEYARDTNIGLSCLPLSNKDDLFGEYMKHIDAGLPLEDVLTLGRIDGVQAMTQKH
jgi:hypothetical protein